MDDQAVGRNVLQDERGAWSFARVALAIVLGNVLGLCWYVVLHNGLTVANAVWAILTTAMTGLMTWAAGPRMARYLAPSISKATQSVAQALLPSTEPSKTDDERGN